MIRLKSTTSKCKLGMLAGTPVKMEKWNTYIVLDPFSSLKENQEINNLLKVFNRFYTYKDFN